MNRRLDATSVTPADDRRTASSAAHSAKPEIARSLRRALKSLCALAVLGAAWASQAHAADLELAVSGFAGAEEQRGQLMVAVFADSSDWLKKPVAVRRVAVAEAVDGRLVLRFGDLPAGPVAISVFQDLNGNGKLDTNPVGMPLEPFAFSRQAQGNFGPPRFEQAALEAGTTRHAIQLPAMP
ncbi:DUF2141 domain-containing protein [Roseateles amylovorans]|uniref:DUF2141 domain-containing protein n=1 Tax=Roseateles amylovorans TaxID=2978473 RepID=A0ABY6AVI6_9BURK|nr:DUF2141 domain-containing protein [Roseateles amylovorans]UXH76605.1 DUF2141 domain-containing protein [Roseateles amylovorans]